MKDMIEKIKETTLKQRVATGAIILLLLGGGTGLAVNRHNEKVLADTNAKIVKADKKAKLEKHLKADKEAKIKADNEAKAKAEADKQAQAKAQAEQVQAVATQQAEQAQAQAVAEQQAQAQATEQAQATYTAPEQQTPSYTAPTLNQGQDAVIDWSQAGLDKAELEGGKGGPAGGSTPWD